jgi:excisionase family DNA binding protein
MAPNFKRWDDDVVEFLRQLCAQGHSLDELTLRFNAVTGWNVTKDTIVRARRRYNISRRRVSWNLEAMEILYRDWGLQTSKTIAQRLRAATGEDYTKHAVDHKASSLRLDAGSNQGLMCIADAARELKIPRSTLATFLKARGFRLQRGSRYSYLSEKAWEAAQQTYAPVAEPALTVAQAAKRLAFCDAVIERMLREGMLSYVQIGRRRKVSKASVEALLAARRRSAS